MVKLEVVLVLVGMYAVNVMGCRSSECCLCSSLLPFFENWQLLFVKQVFLDTYQGSGSGQVVHNVLFSPFLLTGFKFFHVNTHNKSNMTEQPRYTFHCY